MEFRLHSGQHSDGLAKMVLFATGQAGPYVADGCGVKKLVFVTETRGAKFKHVYFRSPVGPSMYALSKSMCTIRTITMFLQLFCKSYYNFIIVYYRAKKFAPNLKCLRRYFCIGSSYLKQRRRLRPIGKYGQQKYSEASPPYAKKNPASRSQHARRT